MRKFASIGRKPWVRSGLGSAATVLVLAVWLPSRESGGATRNWDTGSGSWSVAGNWNPTGVPGDGDDVNITGITTGNDTITYDYSGPLVTLSSFTMDALHNTGATVALTMSDGSLIVNNEYIGSGPIGTTPTVATITLNGGVGCINTINDNLYLGYNSADQGTYNLSSASQIFATNNTVETIGYSGTGTFNQTGSSINNAPSMFIANNAGSFGSYNLGNAIGGDTAALISQFQYVGYGGSGFFTQTGCSNTVAQFLEVGQLGGSLGVYTLNSGSLSAENENIGYSGSGTFNNEGGTNTVLALTLGGFLGSTGTYHLDGSASLSITVGSEIVGNSGTGFFYQNGGTNTLGGQELYVALNAGSTGTYSLGNGTLSASVESIGHAGTGTFTQTAGTNIINNPGGFIVGLVIGNFTAGLGTYNLSGTGSLETVGGEWIGYNSVGNSTQAGGTFNQTGGTNNLTASGELALGVNDKATGVYNLSGGTLSVPGGEYIGDQGSGTFTESGGANTLNTTNFLELSYISEMGIYNLSGNAMLTVTGGEIIGVNGTGVFNQTGGTNHVTNQSYPFNGFDMGYENNGTGTYNLSGSQSTLFVDGTDENIGYGATGIFNQSGGTNHLNNGNLVLGALAGATGTYTLNGTGTLNDTGSDYIGEAGMGHFIQSDNSEYDNGVSISLGYAGGSVGIYDISGNAFLDTADLVIGNEGTGTFNQTGGTVSISGNGLTLAASVGSGTYNLSGNSSLVVDGGSVDIGYHGNGVFNQAGGAASFYDGMALAVMPGSSGTYNLSGGHLYTDTMTVGSVNAYGYVDQTGGSASTGSLHIAAGSRYDLSGGTLECQTIFLLGGTAANSFTNLTVSGNAVLTIDLALVFPNTDDALLDFTGGRIVVNSLNAYGRFSSAIQWTGGTLEITSSVIFDPAASSFSPNSTAAFGSALSLGSGQGLTIDGDESLGLSDPGLAQPFALTLNSGAVNTVSGQLQVNPTGTLTINSGSALSFGSFVLAGGIVNGTLVNQTSFTYQSGTFNGRLINQGMVALEGNFTAGNGIENDTTISVAPGQTVTANGLGLDNEGYLGVNGGTLNLGPSSTQLNNGNINLSNGAVLNLASGAAVTNNSTIVLSGAFLNGSGMLINGASGTISGYGQISSGLSNTGFLVPVGGSLKLVNPFTNLGFIEPTLGATLTGAAVINGGTIQGNGLITNSVTNNNSIEAVAGTLSFTGPVANNASGTIAATLGNKVLFTGGLSNAGTINLEGGTLDTSSSTLNNAGAIIGYGILRTGGLTNNGSILFTGGSTTVSGALTNAAGKSINIEYQPALFLGAVTNTGTIKVTNTTVTFAGSYSGNSYISDPSTNIFQSNVTINSGGAMTGGAGDRYLFSGGNFTNLGTFSNGGLLQSSDSTSNAGTFTQSGQQIWSSGSLFTNTGGTATFSTDTGSSGASLAISATAGQVTFQSDQHLISLFISGSAQIDVMSNKLAVSSTPASTIGFYLTLGYDHGRWDGPGLVSSIAAHGNGSTTLGYFDTGAGINVKYTWIGDVNLDGIINSADLSAISPTGTTWQTGDLNYDAKVNADDYALFALGSAASGGANISTTLPEPALLAGELLLAVCIGFRRRAKNDAV